MDELIGQVRIEIGVDHDNLTQPLPASADRHNTFFESIGDIIAHLAVAATGQDIAVIARSQTVQFGCGPEKNGIDAQGLRFFQHAPDEAFQLGIRIGFVHGKHGRSVPDFFAPAEFFGFDRP